jgi:hypothetical protein
VKVVQLGQVKDLLKEWEAVRDAIRGGRLTGFSICLRGPVGDEAIYTGGHYKTNAVDAARVAMRMSWERTKEEDARNLLEETGT